MKRTILIILLCFGFCITSAQTAALKKCTYNTPELSFAFLYPSTMEEYPTVRPHIKASVISKEMDFSYGVNVFDLDLEVNQFWNNMIDESSEEEIKDMMQQYAESEEFSQHNIKVLEVKKNYTIDRIPAILTTQTLDISVLNNSGTAVQWMLIFFYKEKMIQLCGIMPVMSSASELLEGRTMFMEISSSFAVLSQY